MCKCLGGLRCRGFSCSLRWLQLLKDKKYSGAKTPANCSFYTVVFGWNKQDITCLLVSFRGGILSHFDRARLALPPFPVSMLSYANQSEEVSLFSSTVTLSQKTNDRKNPKFNFSFKLKWSAWLESQSREGHLWFPGFWRTFSSAARSATERARGFTVGTHSCEFQAVAYPG